MSAPAQYALPEVTPAPEAQPDTIYLVASGDLRLPTNIAAWPTQKRVEDAIVRAFADLGKTVKRAHPEDNGQGHGFINSQRMGIEVFKTIPKNAPLIVAEAVWQYSHHVLAGLRDHEGPIITIANFQGDWPGLVGLLGLNAGLTKMNKPYSTIWSQEFTDEWFLAGIREWIETGNINHDLSHVRDLPALADSPERELGTALAQQLLTEKAIIGVFDEGCMGMFNAIIEDGMLNAIGIYKERLSQSALYAEMLTVSDDEAAAVVQWLRDAGMRFKLGTDEATELTEAQLVWQAKMYIAALRISDDFGVDAVGIQYQQGLKDLVPASDLVEGILNNVQRPPVTSRDGARVLWEGKSLPHFNEVDEGVAVDTLVTTRIWEAMGFDPANTLHDIRWGDEWEGDFVWVFEISGSVPPSHFANGYADAEGWRQDPVFFPKGGSTIRGFSKPGEVVWSRVYVQNDALHVDLGRATAIELPEEEAERRSQATNPEWPIMHAFLHGVDRNQLMSQNKSNHLQVAYAPDAAAADRALTAKAAMFAELGVQVHLIGDVKVAGA